MPAWQRGGDNRYQMSPSMRWRSRQGGEAVNGVYVVLMSLPALVSALLDARVLTGLVGGVSALRHRCWCGRMLRRL